MKLRILSKDDFETIKQFEFENLKEKYSDENDRTFASWKARWREEAMDHYLGLGWSMGLWEDETEEKFLGFFLGQVFLFYRGMTQTLWMEHLSATTSDAKNYLVDTAYRYAREKHLQRLVFDSTLEVDPTGYKHQIVDDKFVEIFTSKAGQ